MNAPLHLKPGGWDIVHRSDGWYWHILGIWYYYGGPFSSYAYAEAGMLEVAAEFGMEIQL